LTVVQATFASARRLAIASFEPGHDTFSIRCGTHEMLRFRGTTGSIEAMSGHEARVRALANAALVLELTRQAEPDPFALAEAIERAILAFALRQGWHLVGVSRP
jgi:hypothetical protein